MHSIEHLVEEPLLPAPSPSTSQEIQAESSSPPDASACLAQSAVPEEFVDPITCEVMVLPVVLPSGKVIDRSTLQKFIDTEVSLSLATLSDKLKWLKTARATRGPDGVCGQGAEISSHDLEDLNILCGQDT